MKRLLSALVAATLALCAIAAAADGTPGQRKVELTIESTTLLGALDKWAQQSGFQIFVDEAIARNITAPDLHGTFTAQQALEKLLAGTALTYVWINDRAVSVQKKAPAVPAALQQRSDVEPKSPPISKFSGEEAGSGAAAYAHSGSGREGGGEALSDLRENSVPIDEMIVTGTYIHGAEPSSSPVITYNSRDIERSGATTLAGFLEKIPQNFASVGSDTVQVSTTGLNSARNPSYGTAINLRGLGPGSTLVLLNGRRLAPAGGLGQFVDASLIPLSAIERVEIITDGASAIYGADAVGGVVNFIMRSDFDGVEASLRSGSSTRSGAQEIGGSLLAGAASDRGHISFVYDGIDEDGLDARRRSFIPDQGGPFLILPSQKRNSFLVSGERDVTDSVSIYADAIHSKRSYNQDATQLVPVLTLSHNEGDATQISGVAGIRSQLWSGWIGDWAASYSENRETGSSTTEGFPATLNDTRTRLMSFDLHVDGAIGSLGGGFARAAAGLSYRREQYEDISGSNAGGKADRNVGSAAAEILLPFVSSQNARPGLQRLELSLAARYEDYEDFGSSVNPKVGVLWSPIQGLGLRSTYTEAFRAPPLGLLSEANPFALQVPLSNPAAADLDTTTLIFSTAGNSHLKAETSESFTVGFDIGQLPIDGLSLSATYFSVDYTNRIALPPIDRDLFSIFEQQTPLTPYIDSNPTAATIADLYSRAQLVLDATGLGPDGVEAIFYLLPQNVARSRTSGAQLAAAYQFAALGGRADFYLAGDFLFESKYTPVPGAASADLMDSIYNPPRYRLRSGINLSRGALSASLNLNYVPSYPNTQLIPSEQIDSWLTADARVAYQFDVGTESAILRNLEIALAAENITDEDPPAVVSNNPFTNFGYDPTNATPRGRFVSLSLRKSW